MEIILILNSKLLFCKQNTHVCMKSDFIQNDKRLSLDFIRTDSNFGVKLEFSRTWKYTIATKVAIYLIYIMGTYHVNCPELKEIYIPPLSQRKRCCLTGFLIGKRTLAVTQWTEFPRTAQTFTVLWLLISKSAKLRFKDNKSEI